MSVKVAKNRLIDSSLTGFYQYLNSSTVGFRVLGEHLIAEAENAQAFRQTDKLEELSSILSNFPLEEYRLIGQYYLAWCSYRKNQDAVHTFEQVIETSTRYRARALIDLGSSIAGKGGFDSALKYYQQALRYAHDHRALTQAIRSIAAVKGIEGFHNQALKDFERIAPIVRRSKPIEKYQYLNSLAVEFIETGSLKEARNICRILLTSPYTFAYPEWRETANDLELKECRSRSAISFSLKPSNVLQMPEREREPVVVQKKPASVASLDDWKRKTRVRDIQYMDDSDIYMEIMHRTSQKHISSLTLRRILMYVRELT